MQHHIKGLDFYAASPNDGYEPNEKQVRIAQERAALSGSRIVYTKNLEEVANDADVIYGDIWHCAPNTRDEDVADEVIESLLLRLPGPGRAPQAHGEGRELALTTL